MARKAASKSKSKPAAKPKKTAAKKSPAKKSPAKKSPAKKSPAKKSPAKKAPAKKPAESKPAKAAAKPAPKLVTPARPVLAFEPPTYHVPTGAANQRLRDALAWVEDFVVECQRLADEAGPLPWPHANSRELVGLERWGAQLAKSDREAGVCALVLAAQYGLPRVLVMRGNEIEDMGFRDVEVVDGASVESQIDRCARWVDDPSEANRQRVREGFERARPEHAWDLEDAGYRWYHEVGQLASAAILLGDGEAGNSSYDYWPYDTCVGRGLVLCVRGLDPDSDGSAIIRDLYAAMTA